MHEEQMDTWTEAENAYLECLMTLEIRELCAIVPGAENLDRYLVDRDHPGMSSLSLYGEGNLVCTRPLRTPRLAELYIFRCYMTWNDCLHNLRVLVVGASMGPGLAQLVQTLQSSPLLEQLSLSKIISPEGSSDGAPIPLTPINLPRLSTIVIHKIPFDLASGLLERLSPSTKCQASKAFLILEEGFDLSEFCGHAGRICTPQGLEEQIIDPEVRVVGQVLEFETAPDRTFSITVKRWNDWGTQSTMPRRTEFARCFFEASRRASFKVPSSRFRLSVDSISAVAEYLHVVHEFFPETVELEIRIEDHWEAPREPDDPMTEEGNPFWLLAKLSVLRLSANREEVDYGSIIVMAIERMRAPVSSSSALSPITLMTLGLGCVHVELLGRMKKSGIEYRQEGVKIIY